MSGQKPVEKIIACRNALRRLSRSRLMAQMIAVAKEQGSLVMLDRLGECLEGLDY